MTTPERPRLPAREATRIVRTLCGWIDGPSREVLERDTARWTNEEWQLLTRLISIHGLAPHLSRTLSEADRVDVLPAETRAWLAEQDRLNAQRIDRMHGDLRSILRASATAGVSVMPLKGALLTTLPDADPHRRPMADLDLLVRPDDLPQMRTVLLDLGYGHRREPNPRPEPPDMYVVHGNDEVVSNDEHPDNPRRVEVHTAVLRHLWGWTDEDLLTGVMWRNATPGEVLGEPAVLPALADLFGHVAIHASSDLLAGHGRLIQWLDIANLMARQGVAPSTPHPRLAYVSIRLAGRVLPRSVPRASYATLEETVPRALRDWATSVPLGPDCGLLANSVTRAPWTATERWRRWWPTRWRLSVAYGDVSLAQSLMLHSKQMRRSWRGRVRPSERRLTA